MSEEMKRPKMIEFNEDLTSLSIAEIQETIVFLKNEIIRLEQAILTKEKSRSLADNFFKI